MVDDRYSELIAKYLSGNTTLSEKEELLSWVNEHPDNKAFFESSELIWKMADQYEDRFEVEVEDAWDQFEAKLEGLDSLGASPKIIKPKFRKNWWMAVAAAFLLGVVFWWPKEVGLEEQSLVIIEAVDTIEERILPDGTKIWLNKNSRLTYEEPFEIRNVNLDGEAFFDVEEDKERPFTIRSGNSETMVLGTSFNVRGYPSESRVEVTVEEGLVELRQNDQDGEEHKVKLSKGNSGYYDKANQKVVKANKKIENALSWRTKKIKFDNVSIAEVVNTLERHFLIKIQVERDQFKDCTFNGTYEKDRLNLETILEVMVFLFEVEIEKQNNVYLIKGGTCSDF